MLKCEMCLGRRIDAELAVLRSVDRNVEYSAGNGIAISNSNVISVKIDNATIKLNQQTGRLYVELPDQQTINNVAEVLSRYPLSHNYSDIRPLIPNGPNRGKWATATVGAKNIPIFLNAGVITASNANIGANNKYIYMNNGVITPSNANIGTSKKPVYCDTGVFKQCDNTLDVNISGNAATADNATNATNAANAEKATNDNLNQQIDSTYIKGVSVSSDCKITLTKGDGTTSTINSIYDKIASLGLTSTTKCKLDRLRMATGSQGQSAKYYKPANVDTEYDIDAFVFNIGSSKIVIIKEQTLSGILLEEISRDEYMNGEGGVGTGGNKLFRLKLSLTGTNKVLIDSYYTSTAAITTANNDNVSVQESVSYISNNGGSFTHKMSFTGVNFDSSTLILSNIISNVPYGVGEASVRIPFVLAVTYG